ncbi:META domain-containing protein [Treponema sp. R80B11-R83G3]
MKRQILLVLVAFAMIMSCQTTVKGSAFSSVTGKDWKLIEVQLDGTPFNRIVLYDRNDLKKNNVGGVYTMKFDAEMVSGTGAPNKYSAPYTLGDGNAIKIDVIKSTLMAPIVQPEKLQEQAFYNYMQNVEQWSLEDSKLVLQSKADNGNVVKLIFVL